MAETSEVEAAMRAACDAIMIGDWLNATAAFTPEALNTATALAAGLMAAAPTLSGYTIDDHEESDATHSFRVRFHTSRGDVRASASWQRLAGAWRIVAVSLEG